MIHIGITGQSGFIGSHLARKISVSDSFELVPFQKDFFDNEKKISLFASQCDVIIHLAAVSRHENGDLLYRINMELTEKLIRGIETSGHKTAVCLGSTVQIHKDLPYHASKRDSATLLEKRIGSRMPVVNMLMPNVFGPGSKPFYNSVVSTFCYLAANGKKPETISDVVLELSGVQELCSRILAVAADPHSGTVQFPPQYRIRLPELWKVLQSWQNGEKLNITDPFYAELWYTFQSYRQQS